MTLKAGSLKKKKINKIAKPWPLIRTKSESPQTINVRNERETSLQCLHILKG